MLALLFLGLFIFGICIGAWEMVIGLIPFIFFGTIAFVIVFRETWKDQSRQNARRRRR